MKKILILTLGLFLVGPTMAQAPNSISYQAVVRNSAGQLLRNQNIRIRFTILHDAKPAYGERHNVSTDSFGLVRVEIGTGDWTPGPFNRFTDINWLIGTYSLRTEIDPKGDSVYTISEITEFTNVPYALHTDLAGSLYKGITFRHHIGESYGGGVIFHLWKDSLGKEHGLIVHPHDLSGVRNWSNVDEELGNAGSSWDGYSNSLAIAGQNGHLVSAAAICLAIDTAGFNDWYLPSIDALGLLWANHYDVNRTLSQTGGTPIALRVPDYYWSSTERGKFEAWAFRMTVGFAALRRKTSDEVYVRAIRSF
jgi:hypothetical protein